MPDRIRITLTIECPRTGTHTEAREVDPSGLVPVPKVGACAREMAQTVPAAFATAWRTTRTPRTSDHAYRWSPDGPECSVCGCCHA